jgi:MFS family permease
VLAVVSAAQFLTILDLWVVNIALPALQHDFAPATLSDVSWILDVYAIVLAALLLPAGRAADGIGRRGCFLAGLVVFGVASLGCAVAPDLPALIASRALQAAGAAVLMPTSLGLALSVFPAHQRGTAVGVWASAGWPPAAARCSVGCWWSRPGAGSSSSTCPSSSPPWRQAQPSCLGAMVSGSAARAVSGSAARAVSGSVARAVSRSVARAVSVAAELAAAGLAVSAAARQAVSVAAGLAAGLVAVGRAVSRSAGASTPLERCWCLGQWGWCARR